MVITALNRCCSAHSPGRHRLSPAHRHGVRCRWPVLAQPPSRFRACA